MSRTGSIIYIHSMQIHFQHAAMHAALTAVTGMTQPSSMHSSRMETISYYEVLKY